MGRLLAPIVIVCLSLISPDVTAGNYHTLYGFKIGQPLKFATEKYGAPARVISFDDGWKAYLYQREGHNLILETDNTRPDRIVSVQIEGVTNPPRMGLDGIDLGSEAKTALERLGRPDQREAAMDLSTRQPVPDTWVNFYGNSLSFEEKAGKVTSIKVIFGGPAQTDDRPDLAAFLREVKAKNYYRIAERIASEMTLAGAGAVQGPIIDQLTGQTPLNAFLFAKNGVSSLSAEDVADTNLRIAEGSTGFVYKFKDKPVSELYFVQSFEGWVLYSAW